MQLLNQVLVLLHDLVVADLNGQLLLNDLVATWQRRRYEWLHSEGHDAAPDLNCFGHVDIEVDCALRKDEGAELRQVVLQVVPSRLFVELDKCMAPAH